MTGERGRGRLFGTTADLGITASAPDLDALFAAAAGILFSGMCDRRTVRPVRERRVSLNADNVEALMVAWLNELIFIFETEDFLLRRCRVAVRREKALSAVLEGEPYDPARHRLATVFKAATWHRLSVRRGKPGWRARVILDV